jgi:transposase
VPWLRSAQKRYSTPPLAELLLNWFHAKGTISAGIVEGMNNKVKVTTRKAYGFRSYRAVRLALFHNPGGLPEPEFTHRFCG